MITLASLGISCQTAFQLARFAEENPASAKFTKGPIDWLICSPADLALWLNAGMPDFEQGEITIQRGVAWWQRFDIYFWHGFYSKRAHAPHEWHFDIEANFAGELSKLAYTRMRFRSLDPATTLFFISNTQYSLETAIFRPGEEARYHFSEASLQPLTESLQRLYGMPVRLHCVTRRDRATASMLSKADVSVFAPDQDAWTGNDWAWDRVIEQCLRE